MSQETRSDGDFDSQHNSISTLFPATGLAAFVIRQIAASKLCYMALVSELVL